MPWKDPPKLYRAGNLHDLRPAVVVNRAAYPSNWPAISKEIRARSGGQCECTGECGLHRTTPGPRRCAERNGESARWANGKVVLTTAHLCHNPACRRRSHLKAMCQRCHLRYDIKLHARHRAERRERESGQARLFKR